MPLTPKSSWQEPDDSTLLLNLEIPENLNASNLDVYATSCFLKVNCPPWLWVGDLHGTINYAASKTIIEQRRIQIVLQKSPPCKWGRLNAKLGKTELMERRQLSIAAYEKDQAQKRSDKKQQKAKDEDQLMRKQWAIEDARKGAVRKIKNQEKTEAEEDLYTWKESLGTQKSKTGQDEVDTKTTKKKKKKKKTTEEMFAKALRMEERESDIWHSDDEQYDLETGEIINKKKETFDIVLPPPRNQGTGENNKIEFNFTPRDWHVPARESRDEERRMYFERMKKNKELQKQGKQVQNYGELTVEESSVVFLKEKGDEFYEKGDLQGAINAYATAIDASLEKETEDGNNTSLVLLACYSNRAACYLRLATGGSMGLNNTTAKISNHDIPHARSRLRLCICDVHLGLNILKNKKNPPALNDVQKGKYEAKLLIRRGTARLWLGSVKDARDDYARALDMKEKYRTLVTVYEPDIIDGETYQELLRNMPKKKNAKGIQVTVGGVQVDPNDYAAGKYTNVSKPTSKPYTNPPDKAVAAFEQANKEEERAFVASSNFEGTRAGMVFKTGAQGTGYYPDGGGLPPSTEVVLAEGDIQEDPPEEEIERVRTHKHKYMKNQAEYTQAAKDLEAREISSLQVDVNRLDTMAQDLKKDMDNTLKAQADKAYMSGDLLSALELYTQALQLNPAFLPCFSNRAACNLATKKYESAVRDCLRAIALMDELADEDDEELHVEVDGGDLAGITEIVESNYVPGGNGALITEEEKIKVESTRERKRLQKQQEIEEKEEKLKRMRIKVLVRKGASHCWLNQLAASRDDYRKAFQLDTTNTSLKNDLEAIEQNLKSKNLMRKASNLYKQGHYEQSLTSYTKAINHNTKNGNANPVSLVSLLSNRAACHLSIADYNACIKDCQRAMMLSTQATSEDKAQSKHSGTPELQESLKLTLIRRGTAQAFTGNLKGAQSDYVAARKMLRATLKDLTDKQSNAAMETKSVNDDTELVRVREDLDALDTDLEKITAAM